MMPFVSRESINRSRQLSGRVRRYHTWPTCHVQSVAEHSWRVAGIYVEVWGMPRAEVLWYCLQHDVGEFASGDLPFPVKQKVPGLKELTEQAEAMGRLTLGVKLPEIDAQEALRVKVCDLLEMWEFGRAEEAMGNTFAQCVTRDVLSAVLALSMPIEERVLVQRWLRDQGSGPLTTEEWLRDRKERNER